MSRKKKFTPDELMLMAVVEGRLSIHDDHTDKPDPFVGAIITTADGEILAKAHRCELRVGEHCEYTLIERKLVNDNLKECVLYVTLEPCTDSARGSAKKGCSTHIARARLVEINYGGGNPEVKDFGGALVRQLPAILDYVKDKALKLTMDTSKGVREEKSDFPFEALREAIANAVIHRDYTIEGVTNYLYIDPQKIIVRSPGEPPPPLTIQDLQDLDAPSVSRNPKMMYIFNQMRLAEQRGVGLRKLKHPPGRGFPFTYTENEGRHA